MFNTIGYVSMNYRAIRNKEHKLYKYKTGMYLMHKHTQGIYEIIRCSENKSILRLIKFNGYWVIKTTYYNHDIASEFNIINRKLYKALYD